MKIIADTNVLVRAAVRDDEDESRLAMTALDDAESIAVTSAALCEFVWVLGRGYRKKANEIVFAIRRLLASANVETDRPAVEAGLAMLEAGGDFADGVITFEGRRLGGEVFTTFDRKAVALVRAAGGEARLLSKKARAEEAPRKS